MLIENVADLHNILRVAGKARGDQIEALLDAEQNVVAVARAHIRHGQVNAGDIDALLGFDDAVILDGADNIGTLDSVDGKLDQAVIQHDAATGLHIAGQVLIGDGADFVGALDLAGGQGEFLPGHQLFGAVGKGAKANFGTLGVQHGCHGQIQLLRQGAQEAVATGVFLVIAVGEVKTGNVHTVFQQLTQNAGLIGRGTHSANNLCLTHKMYLLMYSKKYQLSALYSILQIALSGKWQSRAKRRERRIFCGFARHGSATTNFFQLSQENAGSTCTTAKDSI